jgi:subtilisin family serine protease
MKVVVTKNLNIRVGAPSVNAHCYIYLTQGTTIEVEDKPVRGDFYDGINLWYKGLDDSYYWSGGITSSSTLIPTENKQSFNWFIELGIETIWKTYKEQGENVSVALLDTGYNILNADLFPAIKDQEVIINYPDTPICNNINDFDGHGTRCLSIIGARNLYQYNIGIAPKCQLLVGKISCEMELIDPNSILTGIKWAIENKADVISISFGHVFDNQDQQSDFQNTLKEIVAGKNVLIFASAGNNIRSDPAFGENYPASFPECISVGATNNGVFDNTTLRSIFTIIHAPGINIESYDLTNKPTPESGTSFSTPIVAAIVALGISYSRRIHGNWKPNDILNKLYNTGTPLFDNRKLINPLEFFKQL